MYIRTKLFNRKGEVKPFSTIEVNGEHAIKLLILRLSENFFGKVFSDKIKSVFDKEEMN